jgi:hypothetical protein
MKYLWLLFLIFYKFTLVKAQQPTYNAPLLNTLATIANTNTTAAHFAKLYYKAIEITNLHLHQQTPNEQAFIIKFEAAFAPLFFQSYDNYLNQKTQNSVWNTYYQHNNLNDLQYKFIGMNAHINGDMANALVTAHTYDSLLKYKSNLLKYQSHFNMFFDSLYYTTLQYKKVKAIHLASLGFIKNIGKNMVYKWRKRAVNMALLWYKNPKKYNRLKKKTENYMNKINQLTLKWLK